MLWLDNVNKLLTIVWYKRNVIVLEKQQERTNTGAFFLSLFSKNSLCFSSFLFLALWKFCYLNMVSEYMNSWSCDLLLLHSLIFVSVSSIIISLFKQSFILVDLSIICLIYCQKWKFFFKSSTFYKILPSQSLILFFSTTCTPKNNDYFSTSDCSIFYYMFASYDFYCYDSQAWWYKLPVPILCLAPPSLQLRGNIKISKDLVLSHVKRLENKMVRMLLVLLDS